MLKKEWLGWLVVMSFFLLPVTAQAELTAGQVSRIQGGDTVEARAPQGIARKLVVGDAVYSGEHVTTGKGTSADLQFVDKSRFSLGPNSEFVIDKFQFKQDTGDAFHSRFIKGVFRFVSGLIAHTQGRDMTVQVRVATIGIRGTQVEGEVNDREEKEGAIVDASAKVVLLEPEEEGKQTAITVSNEFGSVLIDQPGYGTEIPDEKSPPSPVRKMQLHTVENVLRALRSSVRQSGTARPRF